MRKPRVIIFDDEQYILLMLTKYFSRRGYEVLTYNNPTACPIIEMHKNGCDKEYLCADIIITDFKMPVMNGDEFLKILSQRGCKLDVRNKLMISGVIDEKNMHKIEEVGCHLIRKPFTLSELSDWLTEREKHIDLSRPLSII